MVGIKLLQIPAVQLKKLVRDMLLLVLHYLKSKHALLKLLQYLHILVLLYVICDLDMSLDGIEQDGVASSMLEAELVGTQEL